MGESGHPDLEELVFGEEEVEVFEFEAGLEVVIEELIDVGVDFVFGPELIGLFFGETFELVDSQDGFDFGLHSMVKRAEIGFVLDYIVFLNIDADFARNYYVEPVGLLSLIENCLSFIFVIHRHHLAQFAYQVPLNVNLLRL